MTHAEMRRNDVYYDGKKQGKASMWKREKKR